ncbi:tetratricopeptide repeat protein [Moritella viscosa]|nr:tetratricopeptide repeat protein [Moritella viscosa]SGY94238.1 Putative uncharacterized protein [Moritella viscosa]
MYETGHGVAQSYSDAINWYRKAAEQENIYAQTNLGDMYKKGLGVTKNNSEALIWYSKAAEQGYLKAKRRLKYLDGI